MPWGSKGRGRSGSDWRDDRGGYGKSGGGFKRGPYANLGRTDDKDNMIDWVKFTWLPVRVPRTPKGDVDEDRTNFFYTVMPSEYAEECHNGAKAVLCFEELVDDMQLLCQKMGSLDNSEYRTVMKQLKDMLSNVPDCMPGLNVVVERVRGSGMEDNSMAMAMLDLFKDLKDEIKGVNANGGNNNSNFNFGGSSSNSGNSNHSIMNGSNGSASTDIMMGQTGQLTGTANDLPKLGGRLQMIDLAKVSSNGAPSANSAGDSGSGSIGAIQNKVKTGKSAFSGLTSTTFNNMNVTNNTQTSDSANTGRTTTTEDKPWDKCVYYDVFMEVHEAAFPKAKIAEFQPTDAEFLEFFKDSVEFAGKINFYHSNTRHGPQNWYKNALKTYREMHNNMNMDVLTQPEIRATLESTMTYLLSIANKEHKFELLASRLKTTFDPKDGEKVAGFYYVVGLAQTLVANQVKVRASCVGAATNA